MENSCKSFKLCLGQPKELHQARRQVQEASELFNDFRLSNQCYSSLVVNYNALRHLNHLLFPCTRFKFACFDIISLIRNMFVTNSKSFQHNYIEERHASGFELQQYFNYLGSPSLCSKLLHTIVNFLCLFAQLYSAQRSKILSFRQLKIICCFLTKHFYFLSSPFRDFVPKSIMVLEVYLQSHSLLAYLLIPCFASNAALMLDVLLSSRRYGQVNKPHVQKRTRKAILVSHSLVFLRTLVFLSKRENV